jgi:hypothetical protein
MAEQDASIIDQFLQKTDEYVELRNWLQAKLPTLKDTPLEAETQKILADGEAKRGMIDNVYMSIENVLDSAGQTWDDLKSWITETFSLNGMGIAFLAPIPLAIISAASAATISITTWIKTATEQKAKIEQYESLIKDGLSPMEAATVSNQLLKKQAEMGMIEKVGMVLLILGGGYFLLGRKK